MASSIAAEPGETKVFVEPDGSLVARCHFEMDTSHVLIGDRSEQPLHQRPADPLSLESGVAVETTWMPAAFVPGITEQDLTRSLFEMLAEKFEVSLGEASSTIGAATAKGPAAAALGIEPGKPCLRIEMDYRDNTRRRIMAATCYYRGDRYQLHVVLTPNAVTAELPRVP